jgi:hypothetical protein
MRKESRGNGKPELSPRPATNATEITARRASSAGRLMCREKVSQCLHSDQVQFLINTRQIIAVRILGEERFDSRDLERLIDTYKATAVRRAQ